MYRKKIVGQMDFGQNDIGRNVIGQNVFGRIVLHPRQSKSFIWKFLRGQYFILPGRNVPGTTVGGAAHD